MKLVPLNDGHNIVGYYFWCPGCKELHRFRTAGAPGTGPTWDFNGNIDVPTFTPSLRMRGAITCHLNLNNGYITYHSDCAHELRDQTVELPDIPKAIL